MESGGRSRASLENVLSSAMCDPPAESLQFLLENCFFISDAKYGAEELNGQISKYPLYLEPSFTDNESLWAHRYMGGILALRDFLDSSDGTDAAVSECENSVTIQFTNGLKLLGRLEGKYGFFTSGDATEDMRTVRQRLDFAVEAFKFFNASIHCMASIAASRDELIAMCALEGKIISPSNFRHHSLLLEKTETGIAFTLPRAEMSSRSRRFFIEGMLMVDVGLPSDEKHRRILMLIKDYCHYDVTGRDVGLLASCFIVFPNKESVTAEIKRCRRIRMCGFSQNSQSITNDAGEVIDVHAKLVYRRVPEGEAPRPIKVDCIDKNTQQGFGLAYDLRLLHAYLELTRKEEVEARNVQWLIILSRCEWKLALLLDSGVSLLKLLKSSVISSALRVVESLAIRLTNPTSPSVASPFQEPMTRAPSSYQSEPEEESGLSLHFDHSSLFLKAAGKARDLTGVSMAHRYLSRPISEGDADSRPSKILLSSDSKNFILGRRVLDEEFVCEVSLESGEDAKRFMNSTERVLRATAAKQFGVVMI